MRLQTAFHSSMNIPLRFGGLPLAAAVIAVLSVSAGSVLGGQEKAAEKVLEARRYNSSGGSFVRLPKFPRMRFGNGKWEGYLHEVGPVALRFSDEEVKRKRPPSPALPEFTMLSNEYDPYLVEMPLPEDERTSREKVKGVTLNLEPHSVVSGEIDTRSSAVESRMEKIALDPEVTKALRPEEVLIYFESDSETSEQKVLMPFSPAMPGSSAEPIPSRATYTKE